MKDFFKNIGKIAPIRKFWLILLFLWVVVGLIFFVIGKNGKTVVRNFSKRKIFAKCENDGTVIDVENNSSKSFIDGVKIDNQVYKIPDGFSIWVFDKFIIYPSFLGTLIHLLGRDKLNEAPDEGWQPLFEK